MIRRMRLSFRVVPALFFGIFLSVVCVAREPLFRESCREALETARQALDSGDTRTAGAALSRILVSRTSGETFREALRLQVRRFIALGEPFRALQALQALVRCRPEPAAEDVNNLNILARITVFPTRPLEVVPGFRINKTIIGHPLDIACLDSGRIAVIDGSGLLCFLDARRPERMETLHQAEPGVHVHRGPDDTALTTTRNYLLANHMPVELNAPFRLRNIIDAAWNNRRFLVVSKYRKNILVFDADGRYSGEGCEVRVSPQDRFCATKSGITYLLLRRNMTILRLDERGGKTGVISRQAPGYTLQTPVDLTVDALGYIYVLDAGARKIHVFNPSLKWITSIPTSHHGGSTEQPAALSIDAQGYFYILDAANHTIEKYE